MNKLKKIILASLSVVGMTAFVVKGTQIAYRAGACNVAKGVGYENPLEVIDYRYPDLNNDGRADVVLTLKDGREVKFINNGYSLVK